MGKLKAVDSKSSNLNLQTVLSDMPVLSACGRVADGLKAPHGLVAADTCCGQTFPTTKSCAMTTQMALFQFSDLPPDLPMAIPTTDKAA